MSSDLRQLGGLLKDLNSTLTKVLQATVQQAPQPVAVAVDKSIDTRVPGIGDIKGGVIVDKGTQVGIRKFSRLIGPLQSNVEALALETQNMDKFCACAHAVWKMTHKEGRNLYREAKTHLKAAGNWTTSVAKAPSLDVQTQVLRQTAIKKEMDPVKGKSERQRKIDVAGDSKNELVQVARRIGRTMAANGPITIDDITAEMGKRYNVMPVKGKRQHQWKGSVFNKTEWACIGGQPSQQKSAHARPVGLWALKSWLKENTVNGKDTSISSFVMSRLYTDFKRIHPKVDLSKCNCFVGEERLNADIRKSIADGQNKLYEIPTTFCHGAVGAMISPPNPAAVLG